MPSFCFDVGNSVSAPLGLCAHIEAKNKKAALDRLQFLLPTELFVSNSQLRGSLLPGECVSLYINPDYITVKHAEME